MQTKTQKLLPKMLPGTVHAQYVRCGKTNCKCSRGELHGAYYYHFVRVGGKLKKRYLKTSEIELIQNACLARQREKKLHLSTTQSTWKSLRELRKNLREFKDSYK